MPYYQRLSHQIDDLQRWLELRKEQGEDTDAMVARLERQMAQLKQALERSNGDAQLAAREPDELDAIRALRPRGPRVLPLNLSPQALEDRILGAWLGRGAGCTLGIPCEGMDRAQIERACQSTGQRYPLCDYWRRNPRGWDLKHSRHYGVTPSTVFYKGHIDRIGSDDDIIYTVLGLLILEEYGLDFSSADVGRAWLKYLPHACTAEDIALKNLRAGLLPPETGRRNNPFCEWIGADIRSDPWGYASPGLPERAAELAWRDARVSHVRNGIYGEMFFAATIAAAFAVGDVRKAIEIGLSEIPRGCRLQQDLRLVLRWCDKDGDWGTTVDRIYKHFAGMHVVHTNNNAAVTVAGLVYGSGSFERTITLTVMGGWDTDCTGATAGSIFGAAVGAKALPAKWIRCLGDRTETYLIGKRNWSNRAIARRFARLALRHRRLVIGATSNR